MFKELNLENMDLNKYLFFTGKGGVGKTSIASAIAVKLADLGKNILLVSTDPASNLQDIFETDLDNKGVKINQVPGLTVTNLDPNQAAQEYKDSVIGPYKGDLPQAMVDNLEEQLSGPCTVEIAAFNEFSSFITDKEAASAYDHILFDTAPTGHTLRMLQLPSAWASFIDQSEHGASCLGQLSGLEDKKGLYQEAVANLADGDRTSLFLVARPEEPALKEGERASLELKEVGMNQQILIINGLLTSCDDDLSQAIYDSQGRALDNMPENLLDLPTYQVPLKANNMTGIDNLRAFFQDQAPQDLETGAVRPDLPGLNAVIQDLYDKDKKVIFTMGKGGVGKTTIAATVAIELAKKGKKVHLTTTDPADHLSNVIDGDYGITISHIDQDQVLADYQEEVLSSARQDLSEDDLDYIKEDLRSPCTQEIAVFRAFAEIVDRSQDEVVVIDTAPTGHTLLLLESTQSYNQEIARTQGQVPEAVQRLLPVLTDKNQTEVIIVSLAEATPYYEAKRLQEDLTRANIYSKWWVVNSSFYASQPSNDVLKARANNEIEWINKIDQESDGHLALLKWEVQDLKGKKLEVLL